MKPSVGIVAIARFEDLYINEWIQYHLGLGFNHIYVYDNSYDGEKPLSEIISPMYMDRTTIVPAHNKPAFQKQAYESGYATFGKLHDYLLFIDIDEFFTLIRHKDICEYVEFLEEKCPGFQDARFHWEMYDDNGVVERDMSIPVHEFFTHKSQTRMGIWHDNVTKCMLKTGIQGIYFPSVHYPKSRKVGSLKTCNGDGVEIHPTDQLVNEQATSNAKIRHYSSKTLSEFIQQKLFHPDGDGYVKYSTLENRFFNYCQKTPEKIAYYNRKMKSIKPKGAMNVSQFWFG